MAEGTKVYTDSTLNTEIDVMTDERTVAGLADGLAAKVQYTADIDGTPNSSNVGIIDSTGARKVFSTTMESKLDSLISAATDPTPTPISAASLPLPTGAAQDGADITTPSPAMPAGGVGIRGWLSAIWTKLNASLAVTGTFWQATQPVSGTFWQATQPISGTVNTGLAQPLTDTQLRATPVPTSIADGGSVTLGAKADTAWDLAAASPTQQALQKKMDLLLEAIRAGVTDPAAVSIVQAQAQTKGTQDTKGLQVQSIHDAGRTDVAFFVDRQTTTQTAEIIIATMSYSKGFGAPTTGATSLPVTAAKTLRIQSLQAFMSTVAGNTTSTGAIVRMRVNPGGTAVIGSPVAWTAYLTGTAGASVVATPASPVVLPDGRELPAGAGLCFTIELLGWTATTQSPLISVYGQGFEY